MIRSIRILSPLGTALEVDMVPRPRPGRWSPGIVVTIGWEKGSAEAHDLREWIAFYSEWVLGPDAPMLLAAGELWSPLRDGDLERPEDPRFAGKVFAEFTAPKGNHVVDFRPGGSRNCIPYPEREADPIFGPGSGLQLSALIATFDGCPALWLMGGIAVRRGAPGWETWLTTMMARQARA
jgi:hypothetical protein